MSSAIDRIDEVIQSVLNQDDKQEIVNRGTKRRLVQIESSGSALKVFNTVGLQETELAAVGPGPVLSEHLPVNRGRGRPPGAKNKPKGERIVKNIKEKPAFTYPNMITMALLNSTQEKAKVQEVYAFISHHFPAIPLNSSWKNNIRRVLRPSDGFMKEENVMTYSPFWMFTPERREQLIKDIQGRIKENENQMNVLGIRSVGDLPAILNGECPLPDEAKAIYFRYSTFEVDFKEAEFAAVSQNPVCSEDLLAPIPVSSENVPAPSPVASEDVPVNRGRGRPLGSKNKPWEERIVKSVKPKPALIYSNMITMALLNSPQEKAKVQEVYAFIRYHFPAVPLNSSWKNTIRHVLRPSNGFKKEEDVNAGRSNWMFTPGSREEHIKDIQARIKENENQMGVFRMRNVDDLPAILNGECPLREEVRIYYSQPSKSSVESVSSPRSSTEIIEIAEKQVKQEFAQERSYGQPPKASVERSSRPISSESIKVPKKRVKEEIPQEGYVPYFVHPYDPACHPSFFYGYPFPQYGHGMPFNASPEVQQLYNFVNATVSTYPIQLKKPKVEEPSD